MLTVHPDILPLDRQRSFVFRLVQRPDDLLEVHTTPAGRAEIPTATRIAKVEMAAENAASTVERHDGILDVNVVDAVREFANELHRINALPQQMARVEVEAEFLAVTDRIECPAGRRDVERDLGGVHLERESHPAFPKHVENRIPTIGELL